MPVDLQNLVLTGIASATGAAFAAALGLRYGIAKFRKERSFERRLAWYEGAARELVDASGKIARAVTTSRYPALASQRDQAWDAVSDALSRRTPLQAGAELYASNEAYHAIVEAMRDVRALGKLITRDLTGQVARANAASNVDELLLYETMGTMLLHVASRLAKDVRVELGLEELDREMRLYDDEFVGQLEDARAAESSQRL